MKKKLIILLLIIGAGGWWWLNAPAKGKIDDQSKKAATPTPMEYIRYDGKELSFSYENKYELREENGNWLLIGKSGILSQIVVTLKDTAVNDFEEISGVQMRRLNKEKYKEEKIEWQNTTGITFLKNEGYERTVFLIKEGKVLTAAMTANSNENIKYDEEFNKFVNSLELR